MANSPLNSVIAIIAALLLLALPQLGLGVYLIWHDRRETRRYQFKRKQTRIETGQKGMLYSTWF
ncbi:MAG: hypothetical protein M5U34_17380 [Chloroflexi bacterium]|nr:hypothetical protein [Chloroflexota bacterium]